MEAYDDEPTVISYKNDAADPAAILDPRIVELYTKSVCGNQAYIYG
jgi:hypothetical protein